MPLNCHLYIGYCPSYHSVTQYKFPAACCPLIAQQFEYENDIVMSVRLSCHQRGSVTLILCNASRKVGFVFLCCTLVRKEKQEKLKGNVGKHFYRELNTIYMDTRWMHIKLLEI